jgi:hypothetical protein
MNWLCPATLVFCDRLEALLVRGRIDGDPFDSTRSQRPGDSPGEQGERFRRARYDGILAHIIALAYAHVG